MTENDLKVDSLLAAACESHPDLPAYDPTDQYAEPFGCESAMPGNYFKNAGLTDMFRKAHFRGEFAEVLVDVSIDMIERCDDVSWPHETRDQNRQVIGTMRLLLRRWARGGFGEALAMIEYGHVPESKALMTVFKATGNEYDDRQDMDENGHIDFVTPEGRMVQVKTTTKKPNFKDKYDYDTLVWITPDTWDIVEITE